MLCCGVIIIVAPVHQKRAQPSLLHPLNRCLLLCCVRGSVLLQPLRDHARWCCDSHIDARRWRRKHGHRRVIDVAGVSFTWADSVHAASACPPAATRVPNAHVLPTRHPRCNSHAMRNCTPISNRHCCGALPSTDGRRASCTGPKIEL